jgi:hypothetical protein
LTAQERDQLVFSVVEQLADLVRLARQPGKHVILLCAPCSYCGGSKARGLLPLLRQPSLHVWNHLIVDYETGFRLSTIDDRRAVRAGA